MKSEKIISVTPYLLAYIGIKNNEDKTLDLTC
jgi:hypothetical protein